MLNKLHRSGSNHDSSNRSTEDIDNKYINNSLYTLPVIKPPLAQAESDSMLSLNNSIGSSPSPQSLPNQQASAFLPPVASRPEKTKSIVSYSFSNYSILE